MGTRGLLGLVSRGNVRHATYNHWDSYPVGLGQDLIIFILSLSEEDIATMIRNIGEITWMDGNSKPSLELQEHYSKLGFSDTQVSNQNLEDWYCLLHRTQGAAMLPAILTGDLKHAVDQMDFLENGLFCEWAYFIDFENKKLEVWKGGLRIVRKVEEVSFEELKSLPEQGRGFLERIQKFEEEEEVEEEEEEYYEEDEEEDH